MSEWMTKLEKVINTLECHRKRSVCVNDEGKVCPYFSDEDCYLRLTDDALEFLKEQEPTKPIHNLGITRCGNCNREIDKYEDVKYCPNCGKAVKWDD